MEIALTSDFKLNMTNWQQQMENVAMRDRYILEHQMWTDCSFLVGPEGAKEEDLKVKINFVK
jgi:hypothetical protein